VGATKLKGARRWPYNEPWVHRRTRGLNVPRATARVRILLFIVIKCLFIFQNFYSSPSLLPPSGEIFHEVIVPLVSDKAFFQTLTDSLASISAHLTAVHSNFVQTMHALAHTIGDSARPSSSTSSFRTHSHSHLRWMYMPFVGSKVTF
jgi:hypothetical protein